MKRLLLTIGIMMLCASVAYAFPPTPPAGPSISYDASAVAITGGTVSGLTSLAVPSQLTATTTGVSLGTATATSLAVPSGATITTAGAQAKTLTVTNDITLGGSVKSTGSDYTLSSAQFIGPDGSEAAPGVTSKADKTTGLWLPGSGQMIVSISGSAKAQYSGEGLKIYPGYGATTGNIRLHASSLTGATSAVSLGNGLSPTAGIADTATFYVQSGEMWVVDSANNPSLLSPHSEIRPEGIAVSSTFPAVGVDANHYYGVNRYTAKARGWELVQELAKREGLLGVDEYIIIEQPIKKRDWDADEQTAYDKKAAEIAAAEAAGIKPPDPYVKRPCPFETLAVAKEQPPDRVKVLEGRVAQLETALADILNRLETLEAK